MIKEIYTFARIKVQLEIKRYNRFHMKQSWKCIPFHLS